jgi:porin
MNQGKDDTGLPGNIKLGGFYHSSDFADNISLFRAQVGAGPVVFHPNTFGGYLLFDQTLFREQGKDDPAHQGLVGFFRTEGAPSDRNLTQFGLDGGLVYKGLIPTRDYDTLALAGSYLQMSSDIRQGQHYINTLAPGTYTQFADYEGAIEVDYKAQLTAWWTLQFAVERVLHPGGHIQAGNGNPPDAWAFIIATTLRF